VKDSDRRGLFKHRTDLTPRFGDIDAVGHVNNARYASFLEEARIAYAKEVLGWDGNLESLNIVLADLHVEFKYPIFLSDRVYILSRVSSVGGRSFSFEYQIYVENGEGDRLVSTAETALVYYNYREGKAEKIPPDWRDAIRNYESASPDRLDKPSGT
jgi:acyl-CoA thioester hydrolase